MAVPVVLSSPFEVVLFDKDLEYQGTVGAFCKIECHPRHMLQPDADLTVPATHPMVPVLGAKGCHAIIRYHGDVLMTGRVRLRSGQGPTGRATLTYHITDHFYRLAGALAWPNPAAALSSQTSKADVRTGAAETVLKGYVTANMVTRLGLPITVATDQERGDTITAKLGFEPIGDQLMAQLDAAGIGVTLRLDGESGYTLDCYEPATFPQTFSVAGGTIQDWSFSNADPDVTRVIVGNGADTVAERSLRSVVGTNREDGYAEILEAYTEATDAADSDDLDAAGSTFLSENNPLSGLSITLSETELFRYDPTGESGVRVGDKVKAEIAPSIVVDDVLREATLSHDTDNGVTATPVIGEHSDDPFRPLLKAVQKLARKARRPRGVS